MVQCSNPEDIANAVQFGSSYNYGDTVVYSCNEGFTRTSGIIGPIQIYCGPDGQWHGTDTCTGWSNYSKNSSQYFKGGVKINISHGAVNS